MPIHHFEWLAASCLFVLSVSVAGVSAEEPSGHEIIADLNIPGEVLQVEGRPAFVLLPADDKRRSPQPWIMYSPTLPGNPDRHETWMHQQFLDAGIAVAGIDIGESYGSPKGQQLMSALYSELTDNHGFAERPCLLGRSRGGLMASSWAIANPDKCAGIAGIYPVFDLRSYPGLEKAAASYEMTALELESKLNIYNPVTRIDKLADAEVPIFIIHGDSDVIVPLKENSQLVAEIYQNAGANSSLRLVVAPGQGHNYWEGFFRCRELIDFAIAQAMYESQ